MKEDKIIINDHVYSKATLNILPDGLSLERAKTVLVDNKKGLAFQGEHSWLSNFYMAPINDKGNSYASVEQGLVHQAALDSNMMQRGTANKIMSTTDPYNTC